MSLLSDRGDSVCRGCGRPDLVSVLDLGDQPLSNEMGTSPDLPDPTFPLHLKICPVCGLGQIGEVVVPERIFGQEYPYLSSASSSWVSHASRYVDLMSTTLDLGAGDLVIEIASNDGYLLEQVRPSGADVLGVEPAESVARIAESKGIPTLMEFFGNEVAALLVAEHGHPRLVVANNVMAHVPDLADFVGGLATLCDESTIVTIENPSFVNLLLGGQFDTIYHEHFSYLTVHAVSHAIRPFDLELIRVDELPTHGGSNRYWLGRRGAHRVGESVNALVERELACGLLADPVWRRFRSDSHDAIAGLRAWVDDRHDRGRTIAAYGAAAKGNTLLNAAHVEPHEVLVAVDESQHKQGKFLPGTKIPVGKPEDLAGFDIEDCLILPWNLAEEIVPLAHAVAPRADLWIAIPTMKQVG